MAKVIKVRPNSVITKDQKFCIAENCRGSVYMTVMIVQLIFIILCLSAKCS